MTLNEVRECYELLLSACRAESGKQRAAYRQMRDLLERQGENLLHAALSNAKGRVEQVRHKQVGHQNHGGDGESRPAPRGSRPARPARNGEGESDERGQHHEHVVVPQEAGKQPDHGQDDPASQTAGLPQPK